MQTSALIMSCALRVTDKNAELVVRRNDPAWHWEVWFAGLKLDAGAAETRFAAQWAAQHALERRLKRAGLRRDNSGYRWDARES